MISDDVTRAVVTVGTGRGFVVQSTQGARNRLIITAAHCPPRFPPCHGASYREERTYQSLLAPLDAEPFVSAECLFADPISDIAVLGPPDDQEWPDLWQAYDSLVESAGILMIADAREKGQAWMLSIDNRWFECTVRDSGGALWMSNATTGIRSGMSGSPVLSNDGSAIGMVCISGGTAGSDHPHTAGGPNPRLMGNLPGWCIQSFKSK
jgi:trypsin-like peptidase